MLPNLSISNLQTNFEEITSPSLTWDFEGKPIDELDAVTQSIYCILSTERFYHSIYSYDYGSELTSLIGQPIDLVQAEAERLIKEALLQDDRILDISGFSFEVSGHNLAVGFTVATIYGDTSQEVQIGPI